MCWSVFWAVCAVVAAVMLYYRITSKPPSVPPMKDGWFGVGATPKQDDETIQDFTVKVDDEVLIDLKDRLEKSRLTEDLEESTFEYGMQTEVLKKTLVYWKDNYDWRKHEMIINSFNHYKTQIEGLMVHFIHVKSKHKTGKPLLLIHGWPGSVWEFYKIIPMLTDPTDHGGREEDAFHVIAPSIPGYGWSEAPHHRGFDAAAAARVFYKLMLRLGYQQYYVQGGDWGAVIGSMQARAYPREVKGLHLNLFSPNPMNVKSVILLKLSSMWPSLFADEKEQWKCIPISNRFFAFLQEFGYFHIQTTKPDTIGIALNDSPIGLAAYILEKFSTWSNATKPEENVLRPDGNLYKSFTIDELLTNVMIYWINGNIKSSVRLYKEAYRVTPSNLDLLPVAVKTGLAAFPGELFVFPKILLHDQYQNIVQYTVMPRGGHFAAFEEPDLLAKDIRAFVSKVK